MIVHGGERQGQSVAIDGLVQLLADHLAALATWRSQWPPFDPDPTLDVPAGEIASVLSELVERLTDNFPFFHPGYAGQIVEAALSGRDARVRPDPDHQSEQPRQRRRSGDVEDGD